MNEVKYACQCNIALCYHRMGYDRESVAIATLAIESKERTAGAKAYYRRAQAYRALDEYE